VSISEKGVGNDIEISTPAERFSDDKHAEQKDHYVRVYRGKGISRGDLGKKKNRNRSPEHDLPYPQREPEPLSDSDEEKDNGKNDNCDIRT
jgi:hypothetical protein